MQDQRGTVNEGHVPGPRDPADDDVVVGAAHTDHETGDLSDDDVREGEPYPAGTYASGSALADSDRDGIADRDDVEVVDHDQALAEERADSATDSDNLTADSTDDSATHDGHTHDDHAYDGHTHDGDTAALDGHTHDANDGDANDGDLDARDGDADARDADAQADAHAEDEDEATVHETTAEEIEAREEDEARGDADFVPADVESRVDERDEADAAATEDAEDRAWAADHATQLRAGSLPEDNTSTYAGDGVRTDDDVVAGDGADAEDRAWAADHATQLRAGSLPDDSTTTYAGDDADVDVADDTDADTDVDTDGERRDDTLVAPVVADEPVNTSEALEGGEALDAADVVAVPVPGAADSGTTGAGITPGQDLRPGAVEPVPVGAIWADGAADGLRGRWRELQLRFIDDPRSVAGEADDLVAEAVSTVTGALESQRAQLSAWQQEGGEDTERLRAAVRQYRDFLDRLLGL